MPHLQGPAVPLGFVVSACKQIPLGKVTASLVDAFSQPHPPAEANGSLVVERFPFARCIKSTIMDLGHQYRALAYQGPYRLLVDSVDEYTWASATLPMKPALVRRNQT